MPYYDWNPAPAAPRTPDLSPPPGPDRARAAAARRLRAILEAQGFPPALLVAGPALRGRGRWEPAAP